MMSLLLPYATPRLSLIAGWGLIGATPRGQPRTPAMRLPHGCEGLRVRRMTVWWTFRRPFMGRPVPRQFMRNALLDLTIIVPATAYHRRSYAERYSRFNLMINPFFFQEGSLSSNASLVWIDAWSMTTTVFFVSV